jgi:hypothetical protein
MSELRSSDLQTVSAGVQFPAPAALAQVTLFPPRHIIFGPLRSGKPWPSGGDAPFFNQGGFVSSF